MKQSIIRVFPRRNKATPDDDMAFVGDPLLFKPEADEVHISCTFTWDMPEAERLAESWSKYYKNVKLGGPAYDDPGGDFIPGKYLKRGYVITSRGCIRNCEFCYVVKREGGIRELPITDGRNILDNNILATTHHHQQAVFDMLTKQKSVRFSGGLDVMLFNESTVNLLNSIKVKAVFFAYDKLYQKPYLEIASKLLKSIGYNRNKMYCYVLVNFQNDTMDNAEDRLKYIVSIGMTPFAMYYRDDGSSLIIDDQWRRFIRHWSRPALIFSNQAV